MTEPTQDLRVRLAAVEHLKRLGARGVISSEGLTAGFLVDGTRVPLTNPKRGIFKPAGMRYLLSVKTVFQTRGRKVWYDDQREVHEQINRGDELVDYAFMGDDPNAADNRWLREAAEAQIPINLIPGRGTSTLDAHLADLRCQLGQQKISKPASRLAPQPRLRSQRPFPQLQSAVTGCDRSASCCTTRPSTPT